MGTKNVESCVVVSTQDMHDDGITETYFEIYFAHIYLSFALDLEKIHCVVAKPLEILL